jgi:D-aspartate ligase
MSADGTRWPHACVVGGIDLVRALGLAGIRSAVVAPPGDFARFSRHVDRVTDAVDASTRPAELVELLLSFAREQPSKPALFYDGDFKLLAISRNRDVLAEAFRFVLPEATLVEDLLDKARFQSLAERVGLPVPRSAHAVPSAGPPSVDLRFPLIVKQLTRQNVQWSPLARTKAIPVASSKELDELWPRLAAASLDVLLQELVPGPETLVESYHAYVDETGATAGEFTGRKIRTYPALYGYSTALEITKEADVREVGRDLLRRLDFRGVAKLDFKRHPDTGALHLLEINPRFNLWHHPGAKAGINIPALAYRDLMGLPRTPPSPARPGARWVHPWFDFRAARAEGVPLAEWLPWVLKCEAKYAFALDDPLPIPRALAARFLRRVNQSGSLAGRAG